MTSEPIVLEHIAFQPEEEAVLSLMGPTPPGAHAAADTAEEIRALVSEARRVARPKAVYRPCGVSLQDDGRVIIGEEVFDGSLLSDNLRDARAAFPFVVTCGRELADWAQGMQDPLLRFWADGISELAMQAARSRLMEHLKTAHDLSRASTMNPGSLPEWPLSQQAPLFRAIGNVEDLIGVTLTESFLMLPVKSVSGIRFPREVSFENCMLCPRDPCKGRRAPFDPALRRRVKDSIHV